MELNQLLRDLENKKTVIDVLMLCETFLTKNTLNLLNIPGYQVFTDSRTLHKGGGTAILVRNGITCKRLPNILKFKEKELESTFVEIIAKNGKAIVIGSLYRPPNCSDKNVIDDIQEIITKTHKAKKELILGMDHNLDLLKSSEHKLTQQFLDSLLDLDMLPTIMRPTRITHHTAALIDNIFVFAQLYKNFESAIILSDMSDHLPILSLLKQSKYTTKQALEFTSCRLNKDSLVKIKHCLLQIDWIGLLNKESSNENFDIFCNKVKEVIDSVSPEVNIKISYKHRYVEPWMSRGIEIASK